MVKRKKRVNKTVKAQKGVVLEANLSIWGVVFKKGILYHLESLTALKNACNEMWISYQVIK